MSDKEIVVNGLGWIINHKEVLYERNKDFDDNELRLLDSMSLVMDRALIINKSNKWSAIPLMINVLYTQLSVCWEYKKEDEWIIFIDKIVTELSKWKEAIESDDKESLYESMTFTISYAGNAVAEMMFSGKRKTTPEEWEIEKDIAVLEDKLTKQEDINESLFNYIAKIENDIAEIEGRITE